MSKELEGHTIAILATDGVERVELEQPCGAILAAGGCPELLSTHGGAIEARQMDIVPAGHFTVDGMVSEASVEDYDGLLLPGGTVNPDKLRMDPAAVGFVKAFVGTGKPVAAICHGPWTLAEAGAEVVDEELVVDGQLMTSRSPADLKAFCPGIIEHFAHARVA